MERATIQLVRRRAGSRCEYCGLTQEFSALTFHVEHIVPRQHGGADDLRNLALACPDCNCHKGTNLTGMDPDTAAVTRLFDPRQDRWQDHFTREGIRILGRTPIGRTTVWLLQMNAAARVSWRELLLKLGKLQ
jgi:hypothetical protein